MKMLFHCYHQELQHQEIRFLLHLRRQQLDMEMLLLVEKFYILILLHRRRLIHHLHHHQQLQDNQQK
jgi:hypothetical protein